MHVFLAGFSAAIPSSRMGIYLEMLEQRGLKIRELSSYVECSRAHTWRQLMVVEPRRCEFFLDSGAFSAWSKGTSIDIEEYAKFILERPDTFDVIANLDVIPGSWGHVPSQKEIDKSAEQGWENYYILEKLLKPINKKPINIYHQGESKKWLKKLIDEAEYFGVSPGNDRTTMQKIEWLDEIMSLLTDDEGWAIRKFHGFGVTSLDIMQRYPWYSVDSTSWVLSGRFGMVHVVLNGKVHKVVFSDQSPKLKEYGGHFTSYSKGEQTVIRNYLADLGFTPQQLAEDYVARDQANILFFLDVEKNWKPRPFKRREIQPTIDLGL